MVGLQEPAVQPDHGHALGGAVHREPESPFAAPQRRPDVNLLVDITQGRDVAQHLSTVGQERPDGHVHPPVVTGLQRETLLMALELARHGP